MNKGIYYYYNMLNTVEKNNYETILAGYQRCASEIRLNLNTSQLKKIFSYIRADHPEIYWVDLQYRYMDYNTYLIFKPQYTYSVAERSRREKQIESSVRNILFDMSHEPSEYGRIKKAFEYLADTVDYQSNALDNQNIYSALVNGRSVCAGYSRAMQYLLQRSGIMALYVPGTLYNRGTHAWNIVRCNGRYYHVDVTFGDPNYTNGMMKGQKNTLPKELRYNYAYLCCDDKTMYRDRIVNADYRVPPCINDNYNYFVMRRSYYHYYSASVIAGMKESIFRGERYWQCQFSNQAAYKKMKQNLQDGLYANMIVDNAHYSYSGSLQTHYLYQPDVYVIKMWY